MRAYSVKAGLLVATLSWTSLVFAEEAAPVDAPAPAESLPAWDWTSKGELALETRAFRDDHNAATADRALGMMGRLEARASRGAFESEGEEANGQGHAG